MWMGSSYPQDEMINYFEANDIREFKKINSMIANTQRQFSADQAARLISNIFTPPTVALPVMLMLALGTAPSFVLGLVWWLTATLGLSLIPFAIVVLGVRRGHYTTIHIPERAQRIVPLLLSLVSVLLTAILLLLEHASRPFMTTIISVLVCAIIALLITLRWKVSFHVASIVGAVTVLSFVFGPLWLVLSPLVLIVAWARWQLRAHTL